MTNESTTLEIYGALSDGERYIGTIISADGTKRHHVILLPGSTKANWKDAMQWAYDNGGDLPDRIEQALMYATTTDLFEKRAYWSNTQHASFDDYAWCQYFYYGYQLSLHKSAELCAVAVRRVAI